MNVIAVLDAMMYDKNLAFPPSCAAVDSGSDRIVYDHYTTLDSADASLSHEKAILRITLRHNAGGDTAFWRDLRTRSQPEKTEVVTLRDTPTNICHYEYINDDILELLNEIDADVEAIDFGGVAPCMVAVMYRHAQVLKDLSKNGADTNATNHAGVSPA